MLKTKTKFKVLVASAVSLLTVCVLNSSIVSASEVEETYVKNLKLTSPKYYEVDLDYLPYNSEDGNTWESVHQKYFKMIGDYYTKQINNKAITVTASSMVGGTDGGLNLWTWEHGTELKIYLNGTLCDTRTMGQELTVPVIKVPNTIAANELNSYLKEVIIKANKAFGEKITKIEPGTKSVAGVEIPNGYTIYSDYGMESVVIVRKEKVSEPVKKEETTTKIKLEADTSVIPANTVLNTKEVKDEKVLNTVKESLKDIATKYMVYDINLLSDGVKIQPNGKVKISIPVPTEYNKSNLVVYRVADNGDKTEYTVKVNRDVATFETDHFSTYVLAEKETKSNTNNVVDKEQKNNNTKETRKKDDTPRTGTTASIYFMIPVAVISAIGIIAFRRKETK